MSSLFFPNDIRQTNIAFSVFFDPPLHKHFLSIRPTLLSRVTYNNFKGAHTFIFIPLLFIYFHIMEMQGREEGKIGQAGGKMRGGSQMQETWEELQVRVEDR